MMNCQLKSQTNLGEMSKQIALDHGQLKRRILVLVKIVMMLKSIHMYTDHNFWSCMCMYSYYIAYILKISKSSAIFYSRAPYLDAQAYKPPILHIMQTLLHLFFYFNFSCSTILQLILSANGSLN